MAESNGRAAPRVPDVALSIDDLRAVTAFNVVCAERVVELFERVSPDDHRPREALAAAAAFVRGGSRSKAQRVTASAAYRAAKAVDGSAAHAAMAAGDAAASAYLHPLADAAQVGHILRGPAFCVLALEQRPADPMSRPEATAVVLEYADPAMIDVLRRYPAAAAGRSEVAAVMRELDERLRADAGSPGAPPAAQIPEVAARQA